MEKTEKKSGIFRIIIILIIIAAVAFGWRYNKQKQADEAQKEAAAKAASAAQMVVLGEVEEANLSTEKEYIGSVEPIQTVNIVPNVAGKIAAVNFKEGSMVRAGQVLFTIEQSEYAATCALRKAQLEQAEAQLENAESYLKRVRSADSRSVSAAELDKAEADFRAAEAAVASARASLQLSRIDLSRTRVRTPITGRVGKALFTKGNYVTAQSSPLAVVVQEDPIRVTFAMPDKDYLDQLASFNAKGAVFKTKLRLSNGTEIEATGTRDFENNTVDSKTGTIAVRLRYANKDGRLIPGAMVRVVTKPVEARLVKYIPQEAVVADTRGDFVYTVDDKEQAVMKRVKLGEEYGKYRFVEGGLETGDKVVVQGIQMLRPGMKVKVVKDDRDTDTDVEKAKQSDYDLKPVEGSPSGSDGKAAAPEEKSGAQKAPVQLPAKGK